MSQPLLDRAIAYMHQSQWTEASNLLEAALKADPTEARALRLLGTTRFMSDRPHEAVELMKSSVAIDPENSNTHQNLGTVYLALGRTTEALESFHRKKYRSAESGPRAVASFSASSASSNRPSSDRADTSSVSARPISGALFNTLRKIVVASSSCPETAKRAPRSTATSGSSGEIFAASARSRAKERWR